MVNMNARMHFKCSVANYSPYRIVWANHYYKSSKQLFWQIDLNKQYDLLLKVRFITKSFSY